MSDLSDFELEPSRSTGEAFRPEPPRRGPPLGWIAAATLAVALVAGLVYMALRRPGVPKTAVGAPPTTLATPSPSATPTATSVPPLDESDAFVRELARGLSSHPQLVAWLATRGLVRAFVASVANVADGENPSAHIAFLAPRGDFAALRKGRRTTIDPRSYARYELFANVVASLDTAACARTYGQLDPLFDAAYRELGHPEGGFSKALARAIAVLEETPVLEGDVPVRSILRASLVYEFVDPRLEALSHAQKQLLRMGPANVRKVKAKLRELSEALGSSTPSKAPASAAPASR